MQIKIILITIFLFLSACATPPEVKLLSIKQGEYFDALILAIDLQAAALTLASQQIVENAKDRIAVDLDTGQQPFKDLMIGGAQTVSDSEKIVEELQSLTEAAEAAEANLDQRLSEIESQSAELKSFLEKMKQTNTILDAYIQSEKAGEAVVKDIVAQPSVSAFLTTANDLLIKVQSNADNLTTLVNGL